MRGWIAVLAFAPLLAQAEGVGKVSGLTGTARRAAAGATQPLALGTEVELGDRLEVEKGSYLKVALNDASVIALGPDSVLEITEAKFAGQTRQAFSGRLWMGKFWAKVTKALAGSDAKFEVSTERAVAGVRGTLFRVDAVVAKTPETSLSKVLARAARPPIDRTMVKVMEGKVGVEAEIKKKKVAAPRGGPRREVAGPQEISLDEWEKKFAELQANQQVTVGESSFQQGTFDPARRDAFDRFVDSP